jgi:hypothetical protein
MNDFYLPYANILLFSCPGCNKPLPIQVMSAARNLETIDADTCDVQCECGWTKEFLGRKDQGVNYLVNFRVSEIHLTVRTA